MSKVVNCLATHLVSVIYKLIHTDQSGFIPSRSTVLKIRRLFLNLQIPVDNPSNRAVLSLDAAKAFDSVEWPYLWEVLGKFGLGDQFFKWVQLLYTNPSARLPIKGDLTDSLRLYKGTRQGCPLSPLLFALALETLAETVRASPSITGFIRGPTEDKVKLYPIYPAVPRGHCLLTSEHDVFNYPIWYLLWLLHEFEQISPFTLMRVFSLPTRLCTGSSDRSLI